MNLLKNVKVSQILGYTAAGTTAKKSTIVDMAGYEGCMFIFHLGALTEAGTVACDINGNSTNATGGTKLAGTAALTTTAAMAALTESCQVVDIYQPDPASYRYLEAMLTPAAQTAVILGITAIQYNGKVKPTTQAASVLKSTQLVSPAAA